MAIQIEVTREVHEDNVQIKTPFYYKHDLMGDTHDSVIYGKITDDYIVTIHVTDMYLHNEISYEIEKDFKPYFQGYASYLTEREHRSSKEEFEQVLNKMKRFIETEV